MWQVAFLLVAAGLQGPASAAILGPRGQAVVAALPLDGGTVPQKLDHFNPLERRTWSQRYASYTGDNAAEGPVFILLGGQHPIKDMDLMTSTAKEISNSLQGRSFYLEHRFYGESRPTGDMTVESLRFLSQDQALADIAYFISYLRKQSLIPEKSKVVLYGGGYAGNLATWARIKYPHLVHAAVASSAPLRAQIDYPEYMDSVMKQIDNHYGSNKCTNVIRDVVDYVDEEAKTEMGVKRLISTFKLCEPFGKKPWDVDMLFDRIATVPISTVGVINNPDVDIVAEVCYALLQGDTPNSKAQKMAEVGGFGMSDDKQCETISYEASIANARKERYGEAKNDYDEQLYDRPILYQSCTEQGTFSTLTQWKGHFPLDLPLQKCKDVFGPSFDKDLLEKALLRTNQEFGGNAPDVRKVVFVRGELDPNNVLGVRDDLEDMVPIITIPGQLASADVHGETYIDPEPLKEARTLIKQLLLKFLKD